jgi:hypothetical protein
MWWSRGGAAQQADLISAIAKTPPAEGYSVRTSAAPEEPVRNDDPAFHHAYALWEPFGKTQAWRIAQFMGLDRCEVSKASQGQRWLQIENDPAAADLVVIDDAALGFRQTPHVWPQAIRDGTGQPWFLLKMSKPVAQGDLWDELLSQHADRLIVITSIYDLRRTEVQISRQLSWERTAQDVVWELTNNPRVNGLSRCAHVIISLDAAGAILLSASPEANPSATLLFDPQVMEGDWEGNYPGGMIGYSTCLVGALARQLMLEPSSPDIAQGIQAGVAALRTLHKEGYGDPGKDPLKAKLHFPIEKIASVITDAKPWLSEAEIQDPVQFLLSPADRKKPRVMPGAWTILEDRYTRSLKEVAERIVLEGFDSALEGVPVGKFGALVTVDRREIEALHSVKSLITEYCQRPQKRPLSIAVFGPPGSGKSFAVTQIAKSARPGQIGVLSFNLSQLGKPADLLDALHQVRDVGLSGKIPLVFWDEFDTSLEDKKLGWLRYFLAPMQDGAFQEGQLLHPIGRAIFVFAGGTSHRMEEFGAGLEEAEQRAAKLPDFISRLKGFLNILGPNRIEGEDDPYFILRRAIILRVLFMLNAPGIIHSQEGIPRVHIDRGILRAFLETRRYKHGVRSMESIIAMSMLAGQAAFERSNLPPENQLNLHVDGLDFLMLVQKMDLSGDLLEKMARAAHEVFCEGLIEQGYQYGAQNNTEQLIHSSLVPYDELPEHEKEMNRENVRDIPNKLAHAGYVMVPARSNEPPFDFPGSDLEILAKLEHERWMEAKIAAGWQYAPKTDKSQKLHSALVSWEELLEREKDLKEGEATETDKDREMVRSIPRILAIAGYAIVKA